MSGAHLGGEVERRACVAVDRVRRRATLEQQLGNATRTAVARLVLQRKAA